MQEPVAILKKQMTNNKNKGVKIWKGGSDAYAAGELGKDTIIAW